MRNLDQILALPDDLVAALGTEGMVRQTAPMHANHIGTHSRGTEDTRHDTSDVLLVEMDRDLVEDNEIELTGRPLLANRPHLKWRCTVASRSSLNGVPGIWCEVARYQAVTSNSKEFGEDPN